MDRSEAFYSAVLSNLGLSLIQSSPENGYLMYGPSDHSFPHIFISKPFDGLPATWSNGYHLAFNAESKSEVEQFYATAMEHGGIDEGVPGFRPHYAEDYYAAYLRDPDGNKLQAVCFTKGRSSGSGGDVVAHITIGLTDLARDSKFYTAIFSALGIDFLLHKNDSKYARYGVPGNDLPIVFVQPAFDGRPATWGNGTHTAFTAKTREQVDLFHRLAIDNGGTCGGPPGLRPQYSAHYYAAYVRDLVGNKLQAVCREPCVSVY